MRWPLRYQILLPFTVLLLGTVTMVSALDAYFSARWHRVRVQDQLRNIAVTLSPGQFPLTSSVLRQTHGLSGAHFAVATRSGNVVAASDADLTSVPSQVQPQLPAELTLGDAVELNGSRFLHASVRLRPNHTGGPEQHLHILYPEQTWHQAWRQNVYPPLITGGVALLLAAVFSALIAAGVSRPIAKLRRQVEQIATGDFQALPEPRRNDEILDLVRSVNRMADTLVKYEAQLRRDERLKALGQLRGGLAHQLRNSVTGCRMALDLHCMRATGDAAQSESLAVAQRQLALVEKHLEQFLRYGADEGEARYARFDLNAMAAEIVSLVRSAADHAHAQVEVACECDDAFVEGDRAALEQVLINLMLNAIEAVASTKPAGGVTDDTSATVLLSVSKHAGHIRLRVSDNGPGPDEAVRDTLFDALVTDKPQGAGLGLAVARDVIRRHHGRLHWHREDGWTHFTAELPAAAPPARERDGNAGTSHEVDSLPEAHPLQPSNAASSPPIQ